MDNPFSKIALLKLEDVGISVVSTLERTVNEFASFVGVDAGILVESDRRKLLWLVMDHWASRVVTQRYPTWRSLLEILNKLGCEEMCQQVEANMNISGNHTS